MDHPGTDEPATTSGIIASTEPVGEFLGRLAPDATWSLRDQPWPPIGEVVEICLARRARAGDVARPYEFGLASLAEHGDDGSSEWKLPDGQTLRSNPDFWRSKPSRE